jgi:hypothetical protein
LAGQPGKSTEFGPGCETHGALGFDPVERLADLVCVLNPPLTSVSARPSAVGRRFQERQEQRGASVINMQGMVVIASQHGGFFCFTGLRIPMKMRQ